ncbi:MAG: hypothetical protein IJ374_08995 [Lachnospiraceae bacterium]|nr:hypothetical protein [Lachnospiraceae bacterium]
MAGFADASKVPDGIDSGIPKGKMYHIACNTWFTSSGEIMPLSFKFEGMDGMIHRVGDLKIEYVEDKRFSGISSKEFCCKAIIGGILHEFKLIFFCEACKWVMMIGEEA